MVFAMLSAPSSRSLPMVGFREAAIARGALPVWTVEASSADTTSGRGDWKFRFPSARARIRQVSGAGLIDIEAGDGVDRRSGLPSAGLAVPSHC